MSSLKTNNISNLNGTLTIPTDTAIDLIDNGTAKAWVNFNGTGTVAVRSSYNVSSITDNGTGDYTVNFTNAMIDANYCNTFGGMIDNVSATPGYYLGIRSDSGTVLLKTVSALRITMKNQSFNVADGTDVSVSVYR